MIKRSKYTFIVAISIESLCMIQFKKRKRIARLKKKKKITVQYVIFTSPDEMFHLL